MQNVYYVSITMEEKQNVCIIIYYLFSDDIKEAELKMTRPRVERVRISSYWLFMS